MVALKILQLLSIDWVKSVPFKWASEKSQFDKLLLVRLASINVAYLKITLSSVAAFRFTVSTYEDVKTVLVSFDQLIFEYFKLAWMNLHD